MRETIFLLLFLGIGPYFIWTNTGIVTDYQLRGEKLEFAKVPTTGRKCLNSAIVFHQCGVKFKHNGQNKNFDYQFLSFGSPEYIFLLRGTKSGEITSNVAQEYFWNRVMTIIFGVLISLLTFIVVVKNMFGNSGGQNQQEFAKRREPEKPATQNAPVSRGSPTFGKRAS